MLPGGGGGGGREGIRPRGRVIRRVARSRAQAPAGPPEGARDTSSSRALPGDAARGGPRGYTLVLFPVSESGKEFLILGLPEFENARLILLEEARAGGWHAWRGGSAIGGDD